AVSSTKDKDRKKQPAPEAQAGAAEAGAAAASGAGENARPEEQVADARTGVALTYAGASQVIGGEGGEARVALFTDKARPGVQLKGRLKAPLLVREALSCLYDIVSSDFRYVPKD